MRVFLLSIICCACLDLPTLAQPLRRNAIALRVDVDQVVRNETQWHTDWGDFSRDLINSRVLVISLLKLGAGDPQVKVRWYFIGRDFDAKRLFIYDSGESEGVVAAGGIKLLASSRDLVFTREQITQSGFDRASGDFILRSSRTTSGQHPWGWAVFVEQNSIELAEQGSVPELLEWTKKEIAEGNQKPPQRTKRNAPFVPQALLPGRKH